MFHTQRTKFSGLDWLIYSLKFGARISECIQFLFLYFWSHLFLKRLMQTQCNFSEGFETNKKLNVECTSLSFKFTCVSMTIYVRQHFALASIFLL